jgi:hypothetical protein
LDWIEAGLVGLVGLVGTSESEEQKKTEDKRRKAVQAGVKRLGPKTRPDSAREDGSLN